MNFAETWRDLRPVVAAWVLVTLVAGLAGVLAAQRARRAETLLAEREQQWRHLQQTAGTEAEHTAAEFRRERLRIQDQLGVVTKAWRTHHAGTAIELPSDRTTAFVELATFGETMRQEAAKAGVRVDRRAQAFGFSSYAQSGPENASLEAVFEQKRALQLVLAALMLVRPEALQRVARELPTETDVAAGSGSQDYFAADPRWSVRRIGWRCTAIQVTFLGTGAQLRQFLANLAREHLIASVIEVSSGADAGDPAAPVERGTNRWFTVTVEVPALPASAVEGVGEGA